MRAFLYLKKCYDNLMFNRRVLSDHTMQLEVHVLPIGIRIDILHVNYITQLASASCTLYLIIAFHEFN